jgi:hypothetical protein
VNGPTLDNTLASNADAIRPALSSQRLKKYLLVLLWMQWWYYEFATYDISNRLIELLNRCLEVRSLQRFFYARLSTM